MIVVDWLMSHGWVLHGRPVKSCHLMSTEHDLDLTELVTFGIKLGIPSTWLHHPEHGVPHYDLTASWRVRAVDQGATELTKESFSPVYRRLAVWWRENGNNAKTVQTKKRPAQRPTRRV